MIGTTLAVIAILSSLGLLRPLLGWVIAFFTEVETATRDLLSSAPRNGKRGENE